jgi:hypothetical protein
MASHIQPHDVGCAHFTERDVYDGSFRFRDRLRNVPRFSSSAVTHANFMMARTARRKEENITGVFALYSPFSCVNAGPYFAIYARENSHRRQARLTAKYQ